MNIVFFDTETSGLPKNYKASVTDLENWPRLVQIGWITYSQDYRTDMEHIVRPNGFSIPESVSQIHGITQEKALRDGSMLQEVLDHFESNLVSCDLLVGHNVSFDMNVVGAEFLRTFGTNPLEGKSVYDTMLKGTEFCKLPGKYGKYKWPKLEELYFALFHETLAQTHTALDDIENTAKCYFEMQRLGIE